MAELQDNVPASKRKLKVKSEGLWLMSFADLSFVLMCFFALLLSFSSMDKQRFENVRDGMLAKSPEQIKSASVIKEKRNNLQSISQDILDEIKRQKLQATVTYDARGVMVELDPRLFFPSGSATITPRYKRVTDGVMKIIASTPARYRIIMEGHTDDQPLAKKAAYKSNWELSAARAVNLLKEFERRGVPAQRLSANAYAHTRPKIAWQGKSGQELAAARAANRRVVVRIE